MAQNAMITQELSARLDSLERQNRRLTRLLLSVLLLGAATAAAAFTLPQDEVVRAQRFVIVDQQGAEQGEVSATQGQLALRVLARPLVRVQGRGPGQRMSMVPTTLLVTATGSLVLLQGGQEVLRLGKPGARLIN